MSRDHLFQKGKKRPPNSGRKKGTRNKFSPALEHAMLLAGESGGDPNSKDRLADYLSRMAIEDPGAFAKLLARIIK